MPQQTIYLDAVTEKLAKEAAQAAGLSVSRWIAEVIQQKTRSQWPPEFVGLAGSCKSLPSLAEIRKITHAGQDAKRESF